LQQLHRLLLRLQSLLDFALQLDNGRIETVEVGQHLAHWRSRTW
jgi:hypothetical protein